jgi:hypothetical protein
VNTRRQQAHDRLHLQQLVQSSWSQHGRIDDVRPVGCSDDEHATSVIQPVHLRQKLIHHLGSRIRPELRCVHLEVQTLSLLALVPSPLLFGHSESSSSKNTMHGLLLRARVKRVPVVEIRLKCGGESTPSRDRGPAYVWRARSRPRIC